MDKIKRKLIWKYFWKRKWGEIKKFLGCYGTLLLILQIVIFVMLGAIFCFPVTVEIRPIPILLGHIFFSIAAIEMTLWGLIILIRLFTKWLRSNWRLATQDAIEELERSIIKDDSTFQNERRKRK